MAMIFRRWGRRGAKMPCSRCVSTVESVWHVCTCGKVAESAVVAPTSIREIASSLAVADVNEVEEEEEDVPGGWNNPFEDESDAQPDDLWFENRRSAAAIGLDVLGMDADGRSAWMRTVEDDDGLEGLYFSMPSKYESMDDD